MGRSWANFFVTHLGREFRLFFAEAHELCLT